MIRRTLSLLRLKSSQLLAPGRKEVSLLAIYFAGEAHKYLLKRTFTGDAGMKLTPRMTYFFSSKRKSQVYSSPRRMGESQLYVRLG